MLEDNKKTIYVVYAADDPFTQVMGTSIISLFENNRNVHFVIYILDGGIQEDNKKKIYQLFDAYGSAPVWCLATSINKELGIKVSMDRGSISQFSRLFLARFLPQGIERVLYLDCDTLIIQSIQELWQMALMGKTVAALKDPFSKYYRRNLGLSDHETLLNSGVLLIDLFKWRANHFEDKLLNIILKYKGHIPQGDQGALNVALAGQILPFNPKFNAITLFYDFSYSDMMLYRKPPTGYYSRDEVTAAKNQPAIVHFTSSFLSVRPWVKGCTHPFVNEWLTYKQLSPWKDSILADPINLKWWKQIYINFYRIAPKVLSVRISGFLQAYGRPWLQKLRVN